MRTGLRRVFDNRDLSVDVLLASACLPLVYQAFEIGGEHYWDGGYTGNPPLGSLCLEAAATDVINIDINPLRRVDVPRTAREIISRVDKICFNSAFISELAAIAFIEAYFAPEAVEAGVRRLFMHVINNKALDRRLVGATSTTRRAFHGSERYPPTPPNPGLDYPPDV